MNKFEKFFKSLEDFHNLLDENEEMQDLESLKRSLEIIPDDLEFDDLFVDLVIEEDFQLGLSHSSDEN